MLFRWKCLPRPRAPVETVSAVLARLLGRQSGAFSREELIAMATCTTCAEDDPSKFSKRMLAGAWARKGAPVRCKSCISEAERAEAAQAAVNAANKAAIKAADGDIKQERCAGCSKMLAPSAFSRSQLLQKGEAKRCRACVGAAGARCFVELGLALGVGRRD